MASKTDTLLYLMATRVIKTTKEMGDQLYSEGGLGGYDSSPEIDRAIEENAHRADVLSARENKAQQEAGLPRHVVTGLAESNGGFSEKTVKAVKSAIELSLEDLPVPVPRNFADGTPSWRGDRVTFFHK